MDPRKKMIQLVLAQAVKDQQESASPLTHEELMEAIRLLSHGDDAE